MKAHGFTLLELMVALSVLAILAAIAVPSFSSFTANQQLRAASFDLRADLMLARSEALKRNQNVTIKQRTVAGWESGWEVVVSTSGDQLRARKEVGRGVTVDSPAKAIIFNSSGRVSDPAGGVEIALSSKSGSKRCLVLTPSGMPRAYAEACS